jgi:peptidoglycan/xylan/chitin deacetylase (PgdA/CDA1 family)
MLAGAASIAGILALYYRPQLLARWLHWRSDDTVHYRVRTEEKLMALTIDDGPHHTATPAILDLLAEYDAGATFFIIGDHARGNEGLLQRMVDEGHELGNHLMSDNRSLLLSQKEFASQLRQTHDILTPFGPVRWFRPGAGWYNRRMLRQVETLDYELVLGSVYPYDAHLPNVQFMTNYILGKAEPGAIIILHDGTAERGERTLAVLEAVLPALHDRGYRVVSLSELMAVGE